MTTEQLLLIGVVGVAAYFIIKTQTVSTVNASPIYGSGKATIPSAGIPTTPGQASTQPTASGGGITYTNKNLSVELGFDTIKNWFSGIYTTITGGDEKPTITPANMLTSQLLDSSIYMV